MSRKINITPGFTVVCIGFISLPKQLKITVCREMNLRLIFYTIEIFLTLAIIFDNVEANKSNLVDSFCLSD
jgi:hypothetical protein